MESLVVIASLGVMVMVSFIILIVLLYQKKIILHKSELKDIESKHRQKLLDYSVQVAEKERQELARNLHDDIGILLNSILLKFREIEITASKKENISELLQGGVSLTNQTLESVRAIYANLFPATLMKAGFVAGIRELANGLRTGTRLKVNFESNYESIEFDQAMQLQMHRMIREILNNLIKHGGPSYINISLFELENTLRVIILHDGKGILTKDLSAFAEKSKGLGLKSVLMRIENLKGKLDYGYSSDKEARILIEVPLPEISIEQ